MSGRGRHQGRRNNSKTLSSVARETVLSLPADSPVLKLFKSAANKLNERQDRHERLVKLSRDITIESKRIIFLLHTAITKESTEKVLKEANERLHKLINGPLSSIGLELENCPAYLHSRAVTAGFQEFIEARTLFSFMESKSIVTWVDVQKELTYVVNEEETDRTVVTMLPQVDYMLGLADLTGELMRRAINSISSGESEECFDSCQAVRVLYTGYLVESAMYALRVRGGEAPPTLLLVEKPEYDHHDASDDEGFFQSNKC
ncbi:unnamed protein product [Leptidea sinapis]|uniref:Translin-associated protein X n=1 Tax=Leptidea sinapis TaxID=189913 RepID=A0A5E4PZK9_9NEOP|nr:unnamed protein product [Leptidea sinapis]